MQSRKFPTKDGHRIWLNQSEQDRLLDATKDRNGRPRPERRLALELGLHGLRTDEIVPTDNGPGVTEGDVRELDEGDGHVLEIVDGKTGRREVPIADDLARDIFSLKRGASKRKDDTLVDVNPRTVRQWIYDAREVFEEPAASDLGMHDLRRTWATRTFYELALDGVPIAEELTLSWGGWKHSETGRETFRNNYLGPVPDSVTSQAIDSLPIEATPPKAKR